MHCERFQELIDDLARDETLDGAVLHDALAHADSCQSCDALLQESELLTRTLDALAQQHGCEQAPARVEQELLQTLRRSRTPAAAVRPMRFRWLFLAGAGSVAVAALATVLLTGHGVLVSHWSDTPRITTAAPAASRGEENAVAAPEIVSPDALTDEEDVASSYLPLSATFDPSSLEDDAIVRVVLSQSALESLGLPLNLGSDGQVVADLIVSSDGTPQAIRLVGLYNQKGS
jgi:hypothetical protein